MEEWSEAVPGSRADRGAWLLEVEVAVVRNGRVQMSFESWKIGLDGVDVLNPQDSESPGDSGDTPPHQYESLSQRERGSLGNVGFGRHSGKHGRHSSQPPGKRTDTG